MPRISLLGIPIDAVTVPEALDALQAFLWGGQQYHVMTPNSEMLVEAVHNKDFRTVLQQSDFNMPDSVGLLYAARWTGQQLPERVSGADMVTELCAVLSSEYPVFLLGAKPGVAEKAADFLQRTNPNLVIAGTHAGSPDTKDAKDIIKKINDSGAMILFVAFGAPKQDMWIAEHVEKMPSVTIAMGVGGTFDFLAGDIQRAPLWMRSLGLEWLWRLILQPSRIRRILAAVVVFPLMVLRYGKKCPE